MGKSSCEVKEMTYAEWNALYFQLYKRKIKPKTRESYDRLNELLTPILGGLDVAAITPDYIQAALIWVEDQAGSRQAQLAYTLLCASFARALKSGHATRNPVDAVDKPEHHAKQGRAIKGKDWERLKPVILGDVAFALGAYAGLRRGEILALRREDVDFDAGFIHVHRQLVRIKGEIVEQSPKSDAGRRYVPIEQELRSVLQYACKLKHPRARIVTVSPETLNHRWKRAQEGEGIKQTYRLHDLRHTYATRWVEAGATINVVQYNLGHASYQLTADTYTHMDFIDVANTYKKIASLMR